ncbi:MAG: shufflon system plasmid conjugative transfer pilus tip adhesin PilV [Myxococcales bacterium]|nr:shufflon system plasmid conjugative transfer pilus tip adhesin PilV [Myxococcales bacterium]
MLKQHWTTRVAWLVALMAVVLAPVVATAAVQDVLHFEGRLLSKAGAVAPDGDYGMTVRFYAGKADKESTALYVYSDTGVKVSSGLFTVSIGAKGLGGKIDTKHFLSGKAGWIGISVGSDPELPRLQLHKVPYALRANVAGNLSCTGCVTATALAPNALAGYTKTAALAKIATSGSWADVKNKPTIPSLKTCASGQVLKGYKIDGSPVCVIDQNSKTAYTAGTGLTLAKNQFKLNVPYADGRYVNTNQSNSVTSAMIANGQVKAADVDANQVQRRVASACPTGQAIRQINSDGKVICATSVGKDTARWSGKVVKGNWYRIAATKNGQSVSGTFHLYDGSGRGSVSFRVGISAGDHTNMSFTLLNHSRSGALVFDRVRVVENSGSTAHFIDIKAANSATVWFLLSDNDHMHAWLPEKWTLKGTSDSVSGYASRIHYLDRLIAVGDYTTRFSIYRGGLSQFHSDVRGSVGGALRVNTGKGYIDIGPKNTGLAHIETDRSVFYMNKSLRVNSGAVGSYDEDLYLQTQGSTRIHVSKSSGNVGIGSAPDSNRLKISGHTYGTGNIRAAGVVRADGGLQVDGQYVVDNGAGYHRSYGKTGFINASYGGGFYMQDTSWVRIYGNKGVLTGGAVQAGHLRSTGTAQVDKTLTVNSTLYANNGIVIDKQTVIDNGGGWHRAYGKTGFYFGTYGGGLHMADSTWVRIYGSKRLLVNSIAKVENTSGSVELGPATSPYVELRSYKNGTPHIDFSNSTSGDYDVRLIQVHNDIVEVHGGYLRNGCPAGMSTKGMVCISGEISARNQDNAASYCIGTYGGDVCTVAEYRATSTKDTDYYWTSEKCGTTSFVRYRSWYNWRHCVNYTSNYKFRCCRRR